HAVGRRRNLVMDVAGGEHRSGATTDVALVKAALDAPLAVVQPPPYDDIHSKSLVGPGSREPVQLLKPRKTPKDFELSEIPPPLVGDGSAYLGPSLRRGRCRGAGSAAGRPYRQGPRGRPGRGRRNRGALPCSRLLDGRAGCGLRPVRLAVPGPVCE